MIRGNELEAAVHDREHIRQVLAEITANAPGYLDAFMRPATRSIFDTHLAAWERERDIYREYLDLDTLQEFEYDAGAFKSHSARQCPIIRRCLNSRSEVMDDYRRAFRAVSGRNLLDPARNISEFARDYAARFDDRTHEAAATPQDLGLEPLNDGALGCAGVIGYGVQSCLLYGVYPREFAYRSQNAVWALYFLSGRKEFELSDGSEFLMVYPDRGICEQNYLYPAELFGFYALHVFLLLRSACQQASIVLHNRFRYIYLSAFLDHVADTHRNDINTLRQSSESVESQPWW